MYNTLLLLRKRTWTFYTIIIYSKKKYPKFILRCDNSLVPRTVNIVLILLAFYVPERTNEVYKSCDHDENVRKY